MPTIYYLHILLNELLALMPFDRQHVIVVHIHIEQISVGMFAI
jgi:hypothetical protein